MSNCGNCRGKICTCHLNDGDTTVVFGTGSGQNPFEVRPNNPAYRPVGAAHRTTSQSIILNTDTAIIFETTELPISNNMWALATPTRMTAPITGTYMLTGAAFQGNGGAGQVWSVWIMVNGTTPIVRKTVTTQNGGFDIYSSVSTLYRLNAGDYAELWVRSNRTSGTLTAPLSPTLVFVTSATPFFTAAWVGF
jgi:hypothetical protein